MRCVSQSKIQWRRRQGPPQRHHDAKRGDVHGRSKYGEPAKGIAAVFDGQRSFFGAKGICRAFRSQFRPALVTIQFGTSGSRASFIHCHWPSDPAAKPSKTEKSSSERVRVVWL